jgi:HPt (histidine-containing phosphotransfer) domain-containing protein
MNSHAIHHDLELDAADAAAVGHDVLPPRDASLASMAASERAAAASVDEAEVLRRIDSDAVLLEELIELFETERHAMLDAIERAAGADAGSLEREAHKLRGALLNLAAGPAAGTAYLVEQCGRMRSGVPRETLRHLAVELDSVATALESLRPKSMRP